LPQTIRPDPVIASFTVKVSDAVPGHWEGGLIFGSHNSQIATLVERHTRYVLSTLVNSKDTETETVIHALVKQARKLTSELYKSLNRDRGKELVYPGQRCFRDLHAVFL
jgi:IS30 family transposase